MGIFGRVDARALGFNAAYFQLARARGEPSIGVALLRRSGSSPPAAIGPRHRRQSVNCLETWWTTESLKPDIVAVAATVGCPCPGACLVATWASAQTGSSAGSARVDEDMIVLGEASSQQVARKLLDFFFPISCQLGSHRCQFGVLLASISAQAVGSKGLPWQRPFLNIIWPE